MSHPRSRRRRARSLLLALPLALVAPLHACAVDEPLNPLAGPDAGTGFTADDAGPGSGGGGGGGGGAGGEMDAGMDADAAPLEGVLVEVRMTALVAVLLEDLPLDVRDRVADALLLEPPSFWTARATRQIDLTRTFGYVINKLTPLPPQELWQIDLDPAGAKRTTEDGHDVVAITYDFSGVLLTDEESPLEMAKPLEEPGDQLKHLFQLPADPDFVYQRIAEDCVNSNGDLQPFVLCPSAVAAHIGRVDRQMAVERLPWDQGLADRVRRGEIKPGVDLAVLKEGLEHNRLSYRYFEPTDCALEEKCIGAPGWRRLLAFDATVHNKGDQPMHIGSVFSNPLIEHNVFSWSACHEHFHFLHYGDFSLGQFLGDKRAFCLISTSRYSNNETTPLVTPYESCEFQGIAAGWGDDYGIGLDCQWIDVTDVDTSAGPVTLPLKFVSNPDQFLCEGKPVVDFAGDPVFEPTEFVNEQGEPIDRPKCEFSPGWDADNAASHDVTIPQKGGFLTEPCSTLALGHRRECGWTEVQDGLSCVPGDPVQLSCTVADPTTPQVLRLCERSMVLDTGVPCNFFGALTSVLVGDGGATLSFTCPPARDPAEPGGAYTMYAAPAYPADPAQAITCTSL